MDRIEIILLGALSLSAAGLAVAGEPAGFASNGWYAAPASGAPCGFGSVPGCCDCPCHPCDNAWAGYCERKACKQAIWARFGVPKPPKCRCDRPVVVGAGLGGGLFSESADEVVADESVALPDGGPGSPNGGPSGFPSVPAEPKPAGGEAPRMEPVPEPPRPVIEKSTRTWLPWR